jgi:hypothetical protein
LAFINFKAPNYTSADITDNLKRLLSGRNLAQEYAHQAGKVYSFAQKANIVETQLSLGFHLKMTEFTLIPT